MDRDRDNAWRIAGALDRFAADPAAVKRIAAATNYHPPQLREDMESLIRYLRRLEAMTDDSDNGDY